MKTVIKKISLVFLGLVLFSSLNAQTVDMSKYIILTVQQGENISLSSAADVSMDVRIISGSTDTIIEIGHGGSFKADSTTMIVYGGITIFSCKDNNNNLTGIDVSNNSGLEVLDCSGNAIISLDVSSLLQLSSLNCRNNSLTYLNVSNLSQLEVLNCGDNFLPSLNVSNLSQLRMLACWNNNFTTAALDNIFCQLPQRVSSDNARIAPIFASTSSNDTIIATNTQNAISKNWRVVYYNMSDIPATIGTYICSVGIEDVSNDYFSAKLYPNPLIDYLTIEANEYIDRLEILDILGNKIFAKEVNEKNTTFNFPTIKKGVYVIKLYCEEKELRYKVVL